MTGDENKMKDEADLPSSEPKVEVPDPAHTTSVEVPSGLGHTGAEPKPATATEIVATVEVPTIPEDGVKRRLMPIDLIGSGTRITEQAIIEAARELDVEPEVLLAFTKVEAPKGPYLSSGEPTMLYEAHVFSRNTRPKHKYDDSHPTLSSRKWNRGLYGPGGRNQYTRMFKAAQLDQRAALMACSWGSWQVLGENYETLGFKTVEDMVLYCVASEVNQFDVFIRFVKTKRGLLQALRERDWDTIEYLYNGASGHLNRYAEKIESEYKRLVSNELRRGSQGPKVVTLQKLLNKHGANPPVKIDGWFGVATDAAVRDLQSRWNITIDGVVGPQTYERFASERVPDTALATSKRVAGVVVTTGVGGATVVEGVSALSKTIDAARQVATLERLKELQSSTEVTKEVVGTAKEAAEKVVGAHEGAAMTLIFVGVVIIVIAAYFAWTKYYDRKKEQGVD